jgi:Ca2+-binding EF-hand superfamily protein
MSVNKTLNFWNNVKDAPTVVEVGAPASTATKNFLAGDIVKDNNINLYDLSAVVSYFGMIDLSSDPSKYKYAKYDLNRDGKIDSKDVAYVLVSWDN